MAAWNHKGEMLETDTAEVTAAGVKAGKDMYNAGADIFIMQLTDGEMNDVPQIPHDSGIFYKKITDKNGKLINGTEFKCYGVAPGSTVLVDYYVKRTANVKQVEITPDKFGGYFYLEASTLFREEATGRDLPAEFIIPRCKIQSNFTFTMSSTGDPSTFDFVLDAFPDYTKFDQTTKVLAVLQIVEEEADSSDDSLTAQRKHRSENDPVDPAQGEAAEHKTTMYDFDDGQRGNGYSKTDDKVASGDFLKGTKVDTDFSHIEGGTLFGKTPDELQEGITISKDGVISGTSKHVTDYTEFSGNLDEQDGHYLALHVDVKDADTVTVQLLRTAGQKAAVALDEDRAIVLLLENDSDTIKYSTITGVKVVGKKNNAIIEEKTYTLDLILAS